MRRVSLALAVVAPILAEACASIVGFPDVPNAEIGAGNDADTTNPEGSTTPEGSQDSGRGPAEAGTDEGNAPEAGPSADSEPAEDTGTGPVDTGPPCPAYSWADNVDGGTCGALSDDGGIPLSCNYMSLGASGITDGKGYVFTDPSGSVACINETTLCASGSTTVVLPDAGSTTYGAGLGVNLNQAEATSAAGLYTVPAGSTGISYTLSNVNFPKFIMRLFIGDNNGISGTDYCANITGANATVPWSSFNSKCYDTPPDGLQLTDPPSSVFHIEFGIGSQASAVTAQPFNFCITALSFSQ
jgi:hypothetical protein